MLVLITGGARSGKSDYAVTLAGGRPGAKAFIATAEALDEEMALRIAKHRKSRPPGWETFEEPVEVASLLSQISGRFGVIVIDCLTLWMSNILMRDAELLCGGELSPGAEGAVEAVSPGAEGAVKAVSPGAESAVEGVRPL
jgi:adenosyl cobinamide kinase/adenosyl cobinamide phosphate guanylyltransferase